MNFFAGAIVVFVFQDGRQRNNHPIQPYFRGYSEV
jgi:hypothetical protein